MESGPVSGAAKISVEASLRWWVVMAMVCWFATAIRAPLAKVVDCTIAIANGFIRIKEHSRTSWQWRTKFNRKLFLPITIYGIKVVAGK